MNVIDAAIDEFHRTHAYSEEPASVIVSRESNQELMDNIGPLIADPSYEGKPSTYCGIPMLVNHKLSGKWEATAARAVGLILALLSTGCAYTRVELANKAHGTIFVTSANIKGLKVKLTRTSATVEAVDVNHSIPTKEIGNNLTKGGAAVAPMIGGAAFGL